MGWSSGCVEGVTVIDPGRLAGLTGAEERRYVALHPRSAAWAARARGSLVGGVPMGWMTRWPGPFPIVATEAHGARVRDLDGREYVDFCLGEGAAMSGHSPPAVVEAVARQAERGLTHMLPSEDALWVAEELARRFGLPAWHFAVSATDANRFALRVVRALTGRPAIVVMRGYYHGTLDDAPGDWDPALDAGSAATTRAVELNDLDGLEEALAPGDVACVLMEPALTNVGLVLPAPEYLEAVRELTRRGDTLLVLDESHTISAGPGGCTGAWGVSPDVVTVGKTIGGGIAAAAYGFSVELAEQIVARGLSYAPGTGGTVAGNPLALAAMRANLEHVLTDAAYDAMAVLAADLAAGIERVIHERGLPWTVTRLGCRIDFAFAPHPARNAAEARTALDEALSAYLRLYEVNRGILLAPFLGNMLLLSPSTAPEDVARYPAVLRAALGELLDASET